jgi:hypothetical protein
LVVAFKVLHRLDMAEKNMSLSAEELDLVKFLVAQVVSLSYSLAVEMTCEATIDESSAPPPLACKAVDLQSGLVVSPTHPPVVVDASVVIVGSLTTRMVAWVLKPLA